MNTIGILGATGAIGSRTLKLLQGKYKLRASYLHNERQSTDDCEYMRVDVSKEEDLRKFMDGLSAGFKCAGAAYFNGERVSKIAGELKIPYIDPSGETFLEGKLEELKKDNIFVLSSGYFPGLTGVLMRLICEGFDEPLSISGYSVSEEIPSQSAIEDFILTNLSGFGVTGSYYEDGQIKRDDTPVVEIIQNMPYQLTNYLSVEVEHISREFNLKKANWYNASFGEEIIGKLQQAIIEFRQGSDKYKETIKEVPKLFEKKLQDIEGYTYIYVEGTGSKNGMLYSNKSSVKCSCSSELSALIAANTAEFVLNNKVDNGIHYAMDLLKPEDVIARLEDLNVEYKHRESLEQVVEIRKEDSFEEYEEGVI